MNTALIPVIVGRVCTWGTSITAHYQQDLCGPYMCTNSCCGHAYLVCVEVATVLIITFIVRQEWRKVTGEKLFAYTDSATFTTSVCMDALKAAWYERAVISVSWVVIYEKDSVRLSDEIVHRLRWRESHIYIFRGAR